MASDWYYAVEYIFSKVRAVFYFVYRIHAGNTADKAAVSAQVQLVLCRRDSQDVIAICVFCICGDTSVDYR